jgi:hypothetical protein
MAASYWSLLAPAIEMAEKDWYGKTIFLTIDLPNGIHREVTYAWRPAAVGFGAGGRFLIFGDYVGAAGRGRRFFSTLGGECPPPPPPAPPPPHTHTILRTLSLRLSINLS